MGWIWHLCLMNMKRRKIRTFLTVLGVMIGVISVVALMSVGLGVKKEMIDSVVDSGSVNQIKVYSETGGKHKDRMITDKTIETFSKFSNVSGCYSVYEVPVTMKYGEYEYYGNLVGVPGDELSTWKLINGENVIKDSDGKGFAAGSSVGKLFFNPNTYTSFEKKEKKGIGSLTGRRFDTVFGWGDENAKTVKLKLTGVLADGSADIASDDDSDNTEGEVYTSTYSEKSQTIYCDMDYLKSLLKRVSVDGKLEGQPVDGNGNSYREFIYTAAIVTVDDTNNVDAIVKKFQDMGYQTENAKEYLDTIQKYLKMIQLLLGGIGTIALVVAVIGISNTMTTSVFDRVNEIGILKVLGCDIDELRLLFLAEAAIIGAAGGVLGVGCSYGVKVIIDKCAVSMFHLAKGTNISYIPWWLALAGMMGSVVLGVAAGYFPARWATKLRPIDAVTRR
ncbi:ABC transporter permease [Coprococcus eutactus ATCC 27759]|uniref:ABC transporter permease n=2 Tax=Coprococcus eutactus TaxID=33043 RepID=UPI00015EA8FB|nr:ABC transporter permease [Coprococcus eutactus]EDP26172.1 efflux ABC transporter, permease protein [Coprococcus eutactus ATCC 27759]UEA79334.1 ABC transporter permease [Coprococcus eutactus ATCC 27759]CCZ93452.1 efflux ABC transporter permease protein [Coprococcus eutactus CAG:665]